MRIFLIRHGDAYGGLSDLVMAQIKAAANVLKQLDVKPEETLLLTSPLQRAIESAEILRIELRLGEPHQERWLASDGNSSKELSSLLTGNVTTLVVTSHMPDIEDTLEGFADSFGIRFKTRVKNGSIHLVDLTNLKIERLFPE